jgi:hypothetical protein
MQLDAIRRIEVVGTTKGVDEAAQSLKNLASAQSDVAKTSETSTRSQLSAYPALDRLRKSIEDSYRAQQRYDAGEKVLQRAMSQGLVTTDEYGRLHGLLAEKYAKTTGAVNDNSAATVFNRNQMLELGHAAKASFEQLAAGASPLRVLAQQGASTAQALSLGSGGLGGTLKALGGMAVTTLGPSGLIAVGLIAAGGAAAAMYEIFKKDAPTAEKLLEEHNRLLGVIKTSYDEVSKSAKYWLDQSKDATRLQLLQQQIDLQQKLTEAAQKVVRPALQMDVLTGDVDVREKFRPFRDALADLNDSWQKGAPNVRAYVDEVAKIALANPTLQKLGVELIQNASDATKFENTLKQVKAALDVVDGKKLSEDDRRRLGLPEGSKQADPFDAQVRSVEKQIATMRADAAAIDGTVGAHARLRAEAQLLDAAQQKGRVATAAQAREIERLGQLASQAAQSLEKARLASEIGFGRRTALLSQGDAQIAERLKGLYPDVATALGSVEAQAMRANSAFKTMGSAIEGELTSGLTDLVSGTKSAGQAFQDMANSIVKALERVVIELLVVQPLMRSLQSSVSGLGFGSLGGGAATAGLDGLAAIHHTGGIAGESGMPTRTVAASMFAGAPRFHGGGIAGDEVPIIARKGEGVFTREQMAALGGGKQSAAVVNVTLVENPNAQGTVTQQSNSNGGIDIQVAIAQIAAKSAAQPGGAVNRVLTDRFGARQQLASR